MNMLSKLNQYTTLMRAFGLVLALFSMMAHGALPDSYDLVQSDSQIIKLDKPLKRALVANSELVTLKVLSSKELLITAKAVGRTKLILTYKNKPNVDYEVDLNVTADQTMRLDIEATITTLLASLNPEGTVKFELRNIWISESSSTNREVDNIGNQIDDGAMPSVEQRKDVEVLQAATSSGSSGASPLAGNYMVLLTGDVPNNAQKKRIQSVMSALGLSVINMIDITGTQQIKLSVRVAEVIKGNPFRSGTGINFKGKRDRFGLFPPGNWGSTTDFLMNVAGVSDGSITAPFEGAYQIGINPEGGDLFGVLSILEGNNLARVLAKPELVVQAGETAEFLVGGEVPIPVAQGRDNFTVEYKEFGVRLRFSPVITRTGEIQMTVSPEVSGVDESVSSSMGGVETPGFRSRKTTTTITLAAGESFVIGGLIQDNLITSVSKVPFLGDVPVIGALFRSTSYDKDQSELAIMVTPTFVTPIEAGTKVTLPGENIDRPSSLDGFLLGKVVELLPEGETVLPELSSKIGLEKPQ